MSPPPSSKKDSKKASKEAPAQAPSRAEIRAGRFETRPTLSPVEAGEAPVFGLLAPDGAGLVSDPLAEAGLDPEGALRIYKSLRLVRAIDERMMTLQRQGRVGFYGAHTGQEAVPVAVAEALYDRDWIFPALREGPIMLHRGFDLATYLAQIFGTSLDRLKGRNMPSHMAAREVNQVSWSSVIGPQITQAAGAAYAAKLKGDDVVAVGFMGDGATSSADFHTGLNFAAVWQAPALFICQNNHWSISVPTERQTAAPSIAQKALAYGMPGLRVDGNDALALFKATQDAAARARRGEGPTFIECLTYRIGAHSSSDDPRVYRDEAEVEVWRERDPIARLRAFLIAQGHWSEAQDEALIAALTQEVAAAARQAEEAPPPTIDTLFTDVYAELPWHLEDQRREHAEARAAEGDKGAH